MSSLRIKICGLGTEATLDAALEAGADLVGFVHFPKSPRHLEPERAAALAARARGKAERVLLLVDPEDAVLDAVVAAVDPDLIQLHGRECPDRVAAIRARTGRPLMKAFGIAVRGDLAGIAPYLGIADRILLDAKPPLGADLPGGNGLPFDWTILLGADLPVGWMLSGGLTPWNVAGALLRTGASAIDVSSGVETRPGTKDPERIAAFVAAARGA